MSRSSHVMTTEEQARQEFLHIRAKFTLVVVLIAALVLAMFLLLGAVGEYNTQMKFISDQLSSAISQTVEEADNIDDLIDASEKVSPNQEIGIGSNFVLASYVPIAVYKADYENKILLPVNIESGTLSDEAMFSGTEIFLAHPGGYFHADPEGLMCMKTSTEDGDILAFTDASSVEAAVKSYVKAVGSALLLILFVLALVIWTLTSWMIRPLREMWDRQRIFIGNASHELKTPLTTIKANLALVADGKCKTSEDEQQAISQSLAETERMISLVKNLLDIATEKAFSAPKDTFDLSKAVCKQTLLFEAKAFEKGIVIDDSRVEDGVTVWANEENINTLLGILLDNACKYAYKDTSIALSLREDRHHAELRISNVGPALDENMQQEIFNRFVRADAARTGKAEDSSYGLGLAMAQDIVSASDGQISAYMENGEVVFMTKLPLA